jgi:molybdate transport system ATP-binding protein
VLGSARFDHTTMVGPRPPTTALLGPNGAGKSTALEAVAGLVRPDGGAAHQGGRELWDHASGTWLPPHARRVALVTQADSLFPFMSVLANVAFGPRARGMANPDGVAREWLERTGAADLAARRPGTLSGGQARRVEIARALASAPELVVLDEPLAGLDLESATAIRGLLAEVLDGITSLIATHAPLDALALAAAVIVLEKGRVAESGSTAQVLTRPRTAFAARMGGRVLVTGRAHRRGLVLEDGEIVTCDSRSLAPGTIAGIAVHPRDIAISTGGVRDVVTALEPRGDLVRVHGSRLAADVDPVDTPLPHAGEAVAFTVATSSPAYPL